MVDHFVGLTLKGLTATSRIAMRMILTRKKNCSGKYCVYFKERTFKLSVPIKYRSSHRRCSLKKGVLKNFAKFTAKHPAGVFYTKVAGLRPETLQKKRLRHRCLTVNFGKCLRTPFFTEHLRARASKNSSSRQRKDSERRH